MKVILVIMLIVSGMMSAGIETSEHTPVQSPIIETKNDSEASILLGEAAATPIVQSTEATPTPVAETIAAETAPTPATENIATETAPTPAVETPEPIQATASTFEAEARPILLRSVEELSLYDDRATVIGKLGEPKGVTYDEFYSDMVIYEYDRLKVVFFGEYIQSVDIAEDVEEVLLDDRYVATTLADLRNALGEPDYIAEDGIVFQRDEALLKLFLDEASGELISISYYHLATV